MGGESSITTNVRKQLYLPAEGKSNLLGTYAGSIILLSTVGTGQQITLPPMNGSNGLDLTFLLDNATAGANCTITSPTANRFVGTMIVNGAKVAVTPSTTLTIVSGTATAGDRIRIYGTVNFYHIDVVAQAAGAITIA